MTHRAAARPSGSGFQGKDGPNEGRGPSSHAATGPRFAPDAQCDLPPAVSTNTTDESHDLETAGVG